MEPRRVCHETQPAVQYYSTLPCHGKGRFSLERSGGNSNNIDMGTGVVDAVSRQATCRVPLCRFGAGYQTWKLGLASGVAFLAFRPLRQNRDQHVNWRFRGLESSVDNHQQRPLVCALAWAVLGGCDTYRGGDDCALSKHAKYLVDIMRVRDKCRSTLSRWLALLRQRRWELTSAAAVTWSLTGSLPV